MDPLERSIFRDEEHRLSHFGASGAKVCVLYEAPTYFDMRHEEDNQELIFDMASRCKISKTDMVFMFYFPYQLEKDVEVTDEDRTQFMPFFCERIAELRPKALVCIKNRIRQFLSDGFSSDDHSVALAQENIKKVGTDLLVVNGERIFLFSVPHPFPLTKGPNPFVESAYIETFSRIHQLCFPHKIEGEKWFDVSTGKEKLAPLAEMKQNQRMMFEKIDLNKKKKAAEKARQKEVLERAIQISKAVDQARGESKQPFDFFGQAAKKRKGE